jgi:hypothetical protein
MDSSHVFVSLSGIEPGISKISQVTSRFGLASIFESSDGGLCLDFDKVGVTLFVSPQQRDCGDPLVDEVHLRPPSVERLPCGVFIGQLQSDALEMVWRSYEVTVEYEDAVYFLPSTRGDLLASVEFRHTGTVVEIELMANPA